MKIHHLEGSMGSIEGFRDLPRSSLVIHFIHYFEQQIYSYLLFKLFIDSNIRIKLINAIFKLTILKVRINISKFKFSSTRLKLSRIEQMFEITLSEGSLLHFPI